ncbi:MAG: methionyl-tRNA formyltransferase [Gammaproteobacteria bacterium]|nr:methionyl-tRNA formyltransferase [Gammaproteobacteria bacterium]
MLDIVYAGTPEFALPALAALCASDHRVVAVYTQPDRPAGRGRKLQPSPVKAFAVEQGLTVVQPPELGSREAQRALAGFAPDVMVVAAYGLLLPPDVLATPRHGCINIHASLLPRWRGASPIQHAILAGDPVSGVTLMKMDAGLDTGAMIARAEIAIEADWSAAELHDALAPLGAGLLLDALDDLPGALASAQAQDDSRATYAPRLDKQQAEIDWRKDAPTLLREIRAYHPWPVSFTWLDDAGLRLWRARPAPGGETAAPGEVIAHDADGIRVACGEGVLSITELQFAGRRRCSAGDALNARNLTGCRLGRG